MPSFPTWLERLRELLCKMLEAWRADCEILGDTPSDWVAAVTSTYASEGAPTFPDQGAKDDFLETLDELEAHLDDSENSLTAQEDAELRGLITNLRNALSGS